MARNADRELRFAAVQYVASVRRLDAALRAFEASDIPMDPGHGPEPLPWTPQHLQVMIEAAAAFNQVIARRRTWDALRREFGRPL